MKLSLLCICLFLCLSGCTHAFANEEVDYDTLVEHCRLDQVNEISLALSKDLNELSDQLQVISDTKDQLKKQLNQIRLQKETVDKEYDEIRTQGSICLMRLQTRYPFSYDTLIDAYTEYAYDKEFINELKEQTAQKSKIETEYTKINHQYEKLHISCTKLQDQIDHLFSLQDRLFARFSSQIQEFKDFGEYNVHKIIQGNEQLPAYGAIHLEEYETNESCLVAGNYSIDSYSLNWSSVIENGTISAGTWTYPDGGTHLGLDIAASMFSEVKAPANGIVLYADAPVDSDNGYLQNWCGWPAGGGNTICMICAVDEKLYGVSFAHLSNQIYVYPGQQVRQNDLLALSGNSGNSSGPHTHIEIFELRVSLEEAVEYFMQGADFSFGNGFDMPNTCSNIACRIRPENVLL